MSLVFAGVSSLTLSESTVQCAATPPESPRGGSQPFHPSKSRCVCFWRSSETGAEAVLADVGEAMCAAAVRLCERISYRSAGCVLPCSHGDLADSDSVVLLQNCRVPGGRHDWELLLSRAQQPNPGRARRHVRKHLPLSSNGALMQLFSQRVCSTRTRYRCAHDQSRTWTATRPPIFAAEPGQHDSCLRPRCRSS